MVRNQTLAAEASGASFPLLSFEDADDRRRRAWCWGIAILLHVGLFAVSFPTIEKGIEERVTEDKVYVISQPRFKPPEVRPVEIPRERARKVAIPDPTPDAPEPIRQVAELRPVVDDLSDLDVVYDTPAPPPAPEPEPVGPYKVGGEVSRPVKVSGPEPRYSEIARRARIQGVVVIRAIIDKTGSVVDIRVVDGLGFGLDEATVSAVERWRFEPARRRGEPVDVVLDLRVEFNLR